MGSWIISGFVVLSATVMTMALFPGTCPDFTPQAKFKPVKMTGRWFGVYANKYGLPLENIKCVTNDYSYSPVDGSLTVILTQTNATDNKTTAIFVPSEPIDGVPNHAIIRGEMGKGPFQQIFTILYTNYDKTVLTIICASNGQYYGYGVQVYSRNTTLAPEDLNKVKKVLKRENIPQELLPIVQDCQNAKPDSLTSSVPLSSTGVPLSSTRVPLSSTGVPLSSTRVPLSSPGVPLSSTGVPLSSTGVPLSTTPVPEVNSFIKTIISFFKNLFGRK